MAATFTFQKVKSVQYYTLLGSILGYSSRDTTTLPTIARVQATMCERVIGSLHCAKNAALVDAIRPVLVAHKYLKKCIT